LSKFEKKLNTDELFSSLDIVVTQFLTLDSK